MTINDGTRFQALVNEREKKNSSQVRQNERNTRKQKDEGIVERRTTERRFEIDR